MLFTPIQAHPAQQVRAANLLASAVDPTDPGARWQEGISWRSESCPAYQPIGSCEDVTTEPPASTDGVEFYQPVGYRVADVCSTRNVTFDVERVSRLAEAVLSQAMANELWTGVGTKANTYSTPDIGGGVLTDQTNIYLAGPTATTIAATVSDPMQALGILEQTAREQLGGQQCFLHVPTQIATQLGAQIRRVGNLLMTQTDAVIVADPGYPGTGPDGSGGTAPGTWCYATGAVTKRFDTLETYIQPAQTVDRRTNLRQVWAQRLVAAYFDSCCHFAMQIS
jgi:hypothetical protein